MKNLSRIAFVLILAFSMTGPVFADSQSVAPEAAVATAAVQQLRLITTSAALMSFDWKVGDKLNFAMRMKPLPMVFDSSLEVTKNEKEGFWLTQVVDLKKMKQVVETLIDKDTGEIKKMIVNGKPQNLPSGSGMKLIKEEESRITVPAGTFDAIHLVVEDSNHNQTQQWVNPMEIPISGLLKSQAEQSILTITMELVSFARGQ